jgi:hypothetical protein
VLTLSGRSFASRVCASLLRAAGVPEMVTSSPEAYLARAVALATTDHLTLKSLRERLLANRETSTLFDVEGLTRKLEALYAQMAAEYAAGALPQPNVANLDAYLDIGVALDHDADEIGLRDDYHTLYRAALAARHRNRPMPADGRLWDGVGVEAAALTSRAA